MKKIFFFIYMILLIYLISFFVHNKDVMNIAGVI